MNKGMAVLLSGFIIATLLGTVIYTKTELFKSAGAQTDWGGTIAEIEAEIGATLPVPNYLPDRYSLQQVTTYNVTLGCPALQLVYSQKDVAEKVEQLQQEAQERARKEQGDDYYVVKYFAQSVREMAFSDPSVLVLEMEATWSEDSKQWWSEGRWHEFIEKQQVQLVNSMEESVEVDLLDLHGIKGYCIVADSKCSIFYSHSGFDFRLQFNEGVLEEAMKVAKSVPQRLIPEDKVERDLVQEMTLEEAAQQMRSTLQGDKDIWSFIPTPGYLPSEYDLQMVVMDEKDKVFLFYSDEEVTEQVKYRDDLQRLLKQDTGAKFWFMGLEAEGMLATTQFDQSTVESSGGRVVDLGEVNGLLIEHNYQGQYRYEIEWQLNDFYFCMATDYGTLAETEVIKIARSAVPGSIDPA